MGKIVLIVVLGIIAFILVVTICGKKPLGVLRNIVEKFIKKEDDIDIPAKPIGNPINSDSVTRPFPVLHVTQMGEDGSSFYRHDIAHVDFFNSADEMVGIPISRPDADCKGIRLYGEVTKHGQYNVKNKNTYNALTVNTYAVTLGVDGDGFYGEVTNPKSMVYIVDENRKKIKINYGEHFAINDGTFMLINYQWLYFSFPDIPEIPGMAMPNTVNKDVKVDDTIPGFVKGIKKDIGEIVIGARKPGCNIEEKTIKVDKNVGTEYKVTRGFPLDEDDF